jgi:hypothetical protein
MTIDLRRLLQKLTVSSTVLVALAFGSLAHGQLAPPEQLKINTLTWAGTGCPPGSVAGSISDDNLAFTLASSELAAQIPPGKIDRKNCTLVMDLAIPPGWQLAIPSFNIAGFIEVDNGVVARTTGVHKWEGQSQIATLTRSWKGPIRADPYHFTDTIGIEALVWSRCGADRNLLINISASVSGDSGGGIATIENIDFRPVWKRCCR